MGGIMRRHWLPVCMSRGGRRDRTARRCARACWARTWWCSATRNGSVGVLDEHCPHRGASLVFGRNEECGLRCLYHGWKFDVDGNILDMASEPAGAALQGNLKHTRLSGARGRRLRLGLARAAGRRCASSSRRPGRRRPAIKTHRQDARRLQLGAGARGLDRLRAQLEPALHQHAGGRGVEGSTATGTRLAAPVERQGAAAAVRGDRLTASATPRSASRSGSRDPPVRAHHALHRAVHRADPAEQPVQPGADAGADRRREHACSTGSPGIPTDEGHHAGGMAQVLRAPTVGVDLDPDFRKKRNAATTATCRTARR